MSTLFFVTIDTILHPSLQRRFHDAFIGASCRAFFKLDPPGSFERAYQRLLEVNNWDTLAQEILISTPRRFGKTISVSLWSAAMLYSCAGVEISIYSTCKRISQVSVCAVHAHSNRLHAFESFTHIRIFSIHAETFKEHHEIFATHLHHPGHETDACDPRELRGGDSMWPRGSGAPPNREFVSQQGAYFCLYPGYACGGWVVGVEVAGPRPR